MAGLTHFDEMGNAVMVDVTHKPVTERMAIARGTIKVDEQVFRQIQEGTMKKGDVLGVARVAGIMAAKKTSELIPLCHPLMLTKVTIDFWPNEADYTIEACCKVKLSGQTGAEMEALTGVNIALLTIYDMCKALDRGMEIIHVYVEEKDGGKSGHYKRAEME